MIFLDFKSAAYAAWRTFCAALCEAIYPLVATCYKVFMDLATFKIIGSNAMKEIYGKITMILTIVMVFYITFQFVKYIVEPDTMTDKEKGVGKIPQKIMLIVILIAFIPNIFTYLHNIQVTIIKNDIITKIMLGKTYGNADYEKIGNNFAWSMFSMFYNTTLEDNETQYECDDIPCVYIIQVNKKMMINEGLLPYVNVGLNTTREVEVETTTGGIQKIEEPFIYFAPLWAVAVGIFIAYILILYCVDLGARTVQMLYLQVIAPIAIIGILSPKKENIFQKWLKQLITTYLDVFIRLIMLNFILILANQILTNPDAKINTSISNWGKVAIVLGLLVFAKKAPKLLEELFPKMGAAGGNFGLKAGDRNLGRVLGAALGIGAGAATGLASGWAQGLRAARAVDPNARHAGMKKAWAALKGSTWGATRGALGGAGRGFWNGGKKDSNEGFGKLLKNTTAGAKKQFQSNKTYGNKAAAGYTFGKQVHDTVGGYFGHSRKEDVERAKEQSETTVKQRESQEKRKSEILDRAKAKAVVEGKYYGSTTLETAATNYKALEQRKKDLENPNSDVRQQFRVGGEKQDVTSQKAIEKHRKARNKNFAAIDSVTSFRPGDDPTKIGMSLGIKTQDYMDYSKATPTFDRKKYEAAVLSAWKEDAKQKANERYQKALQADGLLYSNQDEADNALAVEQSAIGKEFAKAEDKLYAEYAHAARQATAWDANGNATAWQDNVIVYGDQREEQAERLHNANADEKHQVNMRAEIQNIVNATGLTWEEAELEWRKKYVTSQKQEQQLATNEANDELARINKETASANGSGGKK